MESAGAAPLELGTEKIGTLLRKYAVPGIIAQTAASLYNMVDSIYIGHIPDVGSYAISGLAVTFPLMNISIALGTLVGVGAMTLISILLGQKNYEAAGKVLSNTLTLNTIIGIVFTVFALAFLDPILYFFGASENTIPFARDYMTIIILGNTFAHLMHGFNGIIRCSGHPRTAMGLTLFTVISNAILDPVFIFGLGMGIRGAALATVLCQMLALGYTLYFLADKRRFLHFSKPVFRLDGPLARNRRGAVPYELCRQPRGSLREPAAAQVRRGPGNWRVRHREPLHNALCDDLYGLQPGPAAHCRLQLRRAAVSQGARSLRAHRQVGSAGDFSVLPHCRAHP